MGRHARAALEEPGKVVRTHRDHGRELGERKVLVEILLDELGHSPEPAPGEHADGRRGSPGAGLWIERSDALLLMVPKRARRQRTHNTLPRLAGASHRAFVSCVRVGLSSLSCLEQRTCRPWLDETSDRKYSFPRKERSVRTLDYASEIRTRPRFGRLVRIVRQARGEPIER